MRKMYTLVGVAWMLLVLILNIEGQSPAGLLVDIRDGQEYKTVQIGAQIWMAQNINFGEASRRCYDHDPENCVKYGALYTWEEAREGCPAGWHLPSKSEWEKLAENLGVVSAGQRLKASPDDAIPWDGLNDSGFTALPAGAGNGEGFHRMDDWALFWSSTESTADRAWFAQLDGYWYQAPAKYTKLYVGNYYLRTNQFSVRCISDESIIETP